MLVKIYQRFPSPRSSIALLGDGIKLIAGVDEAGRGACAGPLVIAAVILKQDTEADLLALS